MGLRARARLAKKLPLAPPTTMHRYVEADLAMKEKALAKLQDPDTAARRFRATDSLLESLKTL